MVLRDNSLSNKYLEEFIFMSFLIRPDAEVSHWTNLHWDGFQITALKCQYSSIRHLRIQPDSFDKLVYLNKHQNSPKRLNVASVVGGHLVNQTNRTPCVVE